MALFRGQEREQGRHDEEPAELILGQDLEEDGEQKRGAARLGSAGLAIPFVRLYTSVGPSARMPHA